MYLVHAALRPPYAGAPLPPDVGTLLRSLATREEAVEHVSVHPAAEPDPVVGVFVLADRLTDAERRVAELCRRAVSTAAELSGWTYGRVGAPMVTPYYERLLDGSGLAGAGVDTLVHDRFRPLGSPSNRPELRTS
ncbi:hypothetical protein ABZW30_39410 [Kitasatospora sp. NPDC004669]|uniref:hypothetical protein n=1 Tax=Kitasatospora sp. NPDC004669 TaxID=3154555 RepID=UPI0033B682F1